MWESLPVLPGAPFGESSDFWIMPEKENGSQDGFGEKGTCSPDTPLQGHLQGSSAPQMGYPWAGPQAASGACTHLVTACIHQLLQHLSVHFCGSRGARLVSKGEQGVSDLPQGFLIWPELRGTPHLLLPGGVLAPQDLAP